MTRQPSLYTTHVFWQSTILHSTSPLLCCTILCNHSYYINMLIILHVLPLTNIAFLQPLLPLQSKCVVRYKRLASLHYKLANLRYKHHMLLSCNRLVCTTTFPQLWHHVILCTHLENCMVKWRIVLTSKIRHMLISLSMYVVIIYIHHFIRRHIIIMQFHYKWTI